MNTPLTIGIIGGMSPESTVTYYQHIVRRHEAEFHDHSYPRIVIVSVSFQKYVTWQHEGNWNQITGELDMEFQRVAAAGADFAILATNTMHKVLPSIRSPIPVLSILDAVAKHTQAHGIKSVGLTGTKFTMSDGFYAEGLERRGLRVLTPSPVQQDEIHRIIYEELIFGKISPNSVERFSQIAQDLCNEGANSILLGCTELELLTRDYSSEIRFVDSTRIHTDAAWETSIGRQSLSEFQPDLPI
jgi:aspartate racemase